MRAEFSHLGLEAPATDGLFFALFPDATRRKTGEDGAATLHPPSAQRPRSCAGAISVSLLGFGAHAGLPPDLVASAIDAAAGNHGRRRSKSLSIGR